MHIWFYTDDQRILLQKRASVKKVFPNHWDVSVAGHVGAGEKIEVAAIREVHEEIGLSISENEVSGLTRQVSEIDDLQLFDFSILKNPEKHGSFMVPNINHYYDFIYDHIYSVGF